MSETMQQRNFDARGGTQTEAEGSITAETQRALRRRSTKDEVQKAFTTEDTEGTEKNSLGQAQSLHLALAATLWSNSDGRETENSRLFRIHWATLNSLRESKAAEGRRSP